ncbi:MAG: hypothetical protein M3Q34_01655 [bacterium]|nr:hypothetical protein [bacterium]
METHKIPEKSLEHEIEAAKQELENNVAQVIPLLDRIGKGLEWPSNLSSLVIMLSTAATHYFKYKSGIVTEEFVAKIAPQIKALESLHPADTLNSEGQYPLLNGIAQQTEHAIGQVAHYEILAQEWSQYFHDIFPTAATIITSYLAVQLFKFFKSTYQDKIGQNRPEPEPA